MDQHENWYNMRPREPYRRDFFKHQEYDYKYPHDFGGYIVDSAFQEYMQRQTFYYGSMPRKFATIYNESENLERFQQQNQK